MRLRLGGNSAGSGVAYIVLQLLWGHSEGFHTGNQQTEVVTEYRKQLFGFFLTWEALARELHDWLPRWERFRTKVGEDVRMYFVCTPQIFKSIDTPLPGAWAANSGKGACNYRVYLKYKFERATVYIIGKCASIRDLCDVIKCMCII